MEIIAATAGAYRGRRENATAFRQFPFDAYRKTLIEYVVNKQPEAKIAVAERTQAQKDKLRALEFCYNIMTSGTSGRPLEVPIYGGMVYFQALKHHVKDKIQARSNGQVKPMTRQPPKGRGNRGGLRLTLAFVVNKMTAGPRHRGRHNQIQGTSQMNLLFP